MDREAELRAVVEANAYMVLATADADGRPWVSPVWFAHDDHREFLWVSRPERRHSRNIALRPEVAIVIFDSSVPVGEARAVYLTARAGLVEEDEIEPLMAIFSERSVAHGAGAFAAADVLPPAELRLYRATVTSVAVLGEGDARLPLDRPR